MPSSAALLLGLTLAAAPAVEPLAPPSSDAPTIAVPAPLRALALPLSPDALEALRARDHDDAVAALLAMDTSGLVGSQRADHAFLLAWSLVRAGRAEEAAGLVERFARLCTAPLPYQALVRAEALAAAGSLEAALSAVAKVDDDDILAPRAWVVHAEILRRLGRLSDASELYARIVARPDPAEGNAPALLALARHRGVGSERALEPLRRVVTWYPFTQEGREARDLLTSSYPSFGLTGSEEIRQAERWMDVGYYQRALEVSAAWRGVYADGSEDACRLAWVRGRSFYKRNELSNSVIAFGEAGQQCVDQPGDYGHRALYLQGTALGRKGQHRDAAAVYQALSQLYPHTTYADDGLTRAGIELFEEGALEEALDVWRSALERFPDGDTVPEATFRLAFTLYDTGRPAEAIKAATRLAALPVTLDPVHVVAGAYWAARWTVYPNVDAPSTPVTAPEARAAAIAGFEGVLRSAPHHYYAVLAYSRLAELAPGRAAALQKLPRPVDQHRPWHVRTHVFNHPSVGYGVALARLGLIAEADAEWGRLDDDQFTADERAWVLELQSIAGDWLWAFKRMHVWMRDRPVGTLGPREPEIVRLAYPDAYWSEVQGAAAGYPYPARMFHGLVREESNFDRQIKSHAGAIGLAQLMPATARQTAGWLGKSVSTSQLTDPALNLELGARYLAAVYKQVGNNPFLAMAGYNAGPHRVSTWVDAWGAPPLDEFVERIPFRETRGYVKRVTTSWQTMRWFFDGNDDAFEDLSRFNHSVTAP